MHNLKMYAANDLPPIHSDADSKDFGLPQPRNMSVGGHVLVDCATDSLPVAWLSKK